MELSVMTLNLRMNTENDGENAWPFRVLKVTELIGTWKPLVIGTQEGQHTMLLELASSLSNYAWIGQGRLGGQEGEYSAIFYNQEALAVVESGQFWLSETPEEEGSISWESSLPRICTWAHFRSKTDSNQEFIMYNTHLDHKSQLARLNGVGLIWERLSKHKSAQAKPFMLTGDFNAMPHNQVIRFLRGQETDQPVVPELTDCFSVLASPLGCTFHGFQGGLDGEPIDYIFVTTDVKIMETCVDRSRIDDALPSDHYPVIARISI